MDLELEATLSRRFLRVSESGGDEKRRGKGVGVKMDHVEECCANAAADPESESGPI